VRPAAVRAVATRGEARSEETTYRVVLVRCPPEARRALRLAFVDLDLPSPGALPVVVWEEAEAEPARRIALRLRDAGAEVAIVTSWGGAHCQAHPAELAGDRCSVCGTAVCLRCRSEAGDRVLCPVHRHRLDRRQRRVRVRQLFSLFLLAVFLFKVAGDSLEARDAALNPPVDVGIFQFVPPGQAYHPLVQAMNSRRLVAGRPRGILAIKDWFDAEYQRYSGSRREYLQLHIQGPWAEAVAPPALAGPEDGPLALMWRSLTYTRYWKQLARARQLEPDAFSSRVFVIYTDADGDAAAHSRGSEKGRLAVVHISLDEANPAYAAVTLAHELAHTLGATDKYDPAEFSAAYPEGYVEPYVRPLYPQRYAEIMAVDRPLARGVEAEIRDFDQARVGHRTAAELRWISDEQAAYFYHQEGTDPLDRLQQAPEVEEGG
jgi:hypothetical protein